MSRTISPYMTFARTMVRGNVEREQIVLDADKYSAHVVLIHKGQVFLRQGKGSSGYIRAIIALLIVARRNRHISTEFLLNANDHPLQRELSSTPLFSMCRSSSTYDIPAPNPCGVTDNICSLKTIPWEQRTSSIFSRFRYFCGHQGIGGCQRTFFSRLATNETAVRMSNVSWDVGPVNKAYETKIQAKPYVSAHRWPQNRYLLSTDGWSSSCRFGQTLAMGSVTLKAASNCNMWFEYLIEPYREYVPVWSDGVFDIIEKLKDMQQNVTKAKLIARRGKDAACSLLTQKGHVAYWEAVLTVYQRLLTYRVDDAHVTRRNFLRVNTSDILCEEDNWLCSLRNMEKRVSR